MSSWNSLFKFIAVYAVLLKVRCKAYILASLFLVLRDLAWVVGRSWVFGLVFAKRADERLIEIDPSDISRLSVIGWLMPVKLRVELLLVIFVLLCVA